jgi:MFS family permease
MTVPADHPNASGIPHRRWMIALLLGFGVLVNYFDRVNLSVAKGALHAQFGLSTVAFGYMLSAYSWTYALLQLPIGVLLDRFGVKTIGRIGAILWSAATFMATAAPGVKVFFGSRLLLGVGEAPTFPANSKAIGYWFPRHERSLATAIFDSAAKFSTAIGTPIIGLLLIHFGWRFSFGVTGAISFIYFLAFYFFYRDPKEDKHLSEQERRYIEQGGALSAEAERDSKGGASLLHLLRQRKVIGLTAGFTAYNYCFYLLLTWLPSYFTGGLHLNLQQSVLYTAIPWLFATATDLLFGGWLVDTLIRRGHRESLIRQSVLVGGMLLGLGIAGVIFTRNPMVAVMWISISIGGLAASAPVAWSIPALIAPHNSVGKVGGIMNFGNQIAAISAPIATGYLTRGTNDFSKAFALTAIILLLGIAGYVFLLGGIERIADT